MQVSLPRKEPETEIQGWYQGIPAQHELRHTEHCDVQEPVLLVVFTVRAVRKSLLFVISTTVAMTSRKA